MRQINLHEIEIAFIRELVKNYTKRHKEFKNNSEELLGRLK